MSPPPSSPGCPCGLYMGPAQSDPSATSSPSDGLPVRSERALPQRNGPFLPSGLPVPRPRRVSGCSLKRAPDPAHASCFDTQDASPLAWFRAVAWRCCMRAAWLRHDIAPSIVMGIWSNPNGHQPSPSLPLHPTTPTPTFYVRACTIPTINSSKELMILLKRHSVRR